MSVSDWRRGPGRLFHSFGPAAAKLRSPSFVLVRGTTNVGTLAERSRLPLLTSLANLHLSCKYVGASPREMVLTHRKLRVEREATKVGHELNCLYSYGSISRLRREYTVKQMWFEERLSIVRTAGGRLFQTILKVPPQALKTYKLIEAFPVVLRHQPKGTEQRPAEVVEVRVAVVRVRTGDNARIIGRALTAHNKVSE